MTMSDPEFVLDAVIGFLSSPIWNTPVPTFIEQNCLVFDSEEDYHQTYKEIHEQYKQMVETLLSSFLKDIGITAEQFTAACKERGGNAQFNDIRKNIFEQVWAAEDFEVFKRLMIQKNIELQLQALQLIQQRSGQVLKPEPASAASKTVINEDDEIMKEVLRISKEEYEKKTKEDKKEEEVLQKTLSQSVEEQERLMKMAECKKGELDKAIKTSALSQSNLDETKEVSQKTSSVSSSPSTTKQEKKLETTSQVKSIAVTQNQPQTHEKAKHEAKAPNLPQSAGQVKVTTPSDAAANWMNTAKAEAAASSSGSEQQETKMSAEELERRTEYLKVQRDKLLQLKKQQREKNLVLYTEEQPKARPVSARAAKRAISGQPSTSSPPKAVSPTDDKKLAMRRALADVLKREVIEKH